MSGAERLGGVKQRGFSAVALHHDFATLVDIVTARAAESKAQVFDSLPCAGRWVKA